MMNKFFNTIIFVLFSIHSFGQVDIIKVNYDRTRYFHNPAAVHEDGVLRAQGYVSGNTLTNSYTEYSTGFFGYGKVGALNSSVGGSVFFQSYGSSRILDLDFSYAYDIVHSEDLKFTLGTTLGLSRYYFDPSICLISCPDPIKSNAFSMNIGTELSYKNFRIGGAVQDVNTPNYEDVGELDASFSGYAHYKFDISESFNLRPFFAVIAYLGSSSFEVLGLESKVNQRFVLGGSYSFADLFCFYGGYRPSAGIDVTLGFRRYVGNRSVLGTYLEAQLGYVLGEKGLQ
jgi:hypothetical protein